VFFTAGVADGNISDPGPTSNTAQIVIDPAPPATPVNLQAAADEAIGVGAIPLTWTASSSADIAPTKYSAS